MTDQATIEAFATPQVGDVFHEMYSFWMFVVKIWEEQITVHQWGGHPRDPRMLDEARTVTYLTHEDYRKAYAYNTIPGYTVQLDMRGYDVTKFHVKQLEGTE